MNDNLGDRTESSEALSAPNTQNVEAAQARVTGDELARALTLIEARKDAEGHRLASTIPLGQAIDELGLEITPEEILAEVQVLRRKQPTLRTEPPAAPAVHDPARPSGPSLAGATPAADAPTPLTHCPACARKLLTQASALCNWCGAKIDDPSYQERATRSRQELDQSELSQLETLVQEEARYGIFGRLKRRAKDKPGSKNTLG